MTSAGLALYACAVSAEDAAPLEQRTAVVPCRTPARELA